MPCGQIRTARPILDLTHGADCAVPNPLTELACGLRGLIGDGDLSGHTGLAGNFGDAPRFIDGVGQRLLTEDVFAFLHCRCGYGCVQVIGRADDDGVEILLLFEKLAEVRVGRAAVILAGSLLGTVVAVHDFLTRFAAGDAASDGERMRQLDGLVGAEPIPTAIDAKQFADGVAEFVRLPLGMVGAAFVCVADGDALHIGFAKEAEHDAQTLRTDSDEGDVDFVARWNVSSAA